MPGCRVAGVPGGVYNRTICRSLSRTREVRRSANQIGIPPLVHCHKMAALNQPDSAYCAPPPEAPLAARREKLRLSIHFYRSCFSVSLTLSFPFSLHALLLEFRAFLFLPPVAAVAFSLARSLSSRFHLSLSLSLSYFLSFNNRSLYSIARHTELPCPFACPLDLVSLTFPLSSSPIQQTVDLRSVL